MSKPIGRSSDAALGQAVSLGNIVARRDADVQVEAVRRGRQLRKFLRLPWRLYEEDPIWVPPLLSEQKRLLSRRKNPFFLHAEIELFLARRAGRTCGRVAAVIDRAHNEAHGERTGFFGFFESIEDAAVAEALLSTAARWVAGKGMTRLRGPLSPSMHHECGLLVEGFDRPPVLMMPYNPPYYADLLQGCGLRKARDLYAYWLDRGFRLPTKLKRLAERARKQGITVRQASLRDFRAEVEQIRIVFNEAWRVHWGFVPLSRQEIDFLARGFRPILLPEFALIVQDGHRTVGFLLALPDINQVLPRLNGRLFPFGFLKLLRALRRIKVLRVPLMGVVPAYQGRGVTPLLYLELMERALARGYEAIEMSWVLEDNTMMNRAAEMFAARCYKTYRIYETAANPSD